MRSEKQMIPVIGKFIFDLTLIFMIREIIAVFIENQIINFFLTILVMSFISIVIISITGSFNEKKDEN